MHQMILEQLNYQQQNMQRPLLARMDGISGPAVESSQPQQSNYISPEHRSLVLTDYQMQSMLLEQQNKKRLLKEAALTAKEQGGQPPKGKRRTKRAGE